MGTHTWKSMRTVNSQSVILISHVAYPCSFCIFVSSAKSPLVGTAGCAGACACGSRALPSPPSAALRHAATNYVGQPTSKTRLFTNHSSFSAF